MNSFDAWQRYFRLWTVPLVFCFLTLAALVVYHTTFAGRIDRLQEDFDDAETELAELGAERRESEAFLARIDANRQAADKLYQEQFATAAERFTRAVTEVKNLAQQAQLKPDSFAYPETPIEDWGLMRRGFVFQVEGTYEQLRHFINFLELTEQFLTLEEVSLSETGRQGQNRLAIRLSLSTVFADQGNGVRRPGRSS